MDPVQVVVHGLGVSVMYIPTENNQDLHHSCLKAHKTMQLVVYN